MSISPALSRSKSRFSRLAESFSKKSSSGEPSEIITIKSCGTQCLNGKYRLAPTGNWIKTEGGKTYEIVSTEAVIEDSITNESVTRKAWFISRTDEGVEYNLDYYWNVMDIDHHSTPPSTGWNALIGQDPPPKLTFRFMFKPHDQCIVLPNKSGGKIFHGYIIERVSGGYVVDVDDSTIATYIPRCRLKPYTPPPLAVGNVVETKIKTGHWRNMWIQCQITASNPNELYDVRVLDWRRYNVCAYAKDVPRKLLREIREMGETRTKPKFEVNKYIETMIISGPHCGKWVGAMITNVYMDNTYDVKVLCPAKYRISRHAVSVPERLIREPQLISLT